MRVGSSVVRKTNVRVVAATNVNLESAIHDGRFREDLFYRLNGVLIRIPPLRHRLADIKPLFHKFTNDFADRNAIPPVRLTDAALQVLKGYNWPGNVRQLKNVAEQCTVLAPDRLVDADVMASFIPSQSSPADSCSLVSRPAPDSQRPFEPDRELLYKVLFDMRNEVNDLKKLVLSLLRSGATLNPDDIALAQRIFAASDDSLSPATSSVHNVPATVPDANRPLHSDSLDHHSAFRHQISDAEPVAPVQADSVPMSDDEAHVINDESFSLVDNEKELIRRALVKFNGSRRRAAQELQISERTLYRKINDYGLDDVK